METADKSDVCEQIVVNPAAPGDLSIGDYVFASKWSDCDWGDPWHVGHVSEIGREWAVIGEVSPRRWRRAMSITPEQGRRIVAEYSDMEAARLPLDYKEVARVFGAAVEAQAEEPTMDTDPTVTISAEALSLLTQAAHDLAETHPWPEPAQTELADAIGDAQRVLADAGVDLGL